MNLLSWLFEDSNIDIKEEKSQNKKSDFSNFKIIADYIYEKSGITDLDKRALVFTRLKEFADKSEIYTTDDFLYRMKSEDKFYQEVINIVTVNETYFFRELQELEWLVKYVHQSGKKFKILSMPCSSGEEIYSILLMLSELNVDISKIELTGYDINNEAILKAKKGCYNSRSLHKVEANLISKYFIKKSDDLYCVSSSFKNSVEFFQKNIFELGNENKKFDIILSRNMFIYFDNKKRFEATNIIVNLLKDGGIYIKGHADYMKSNPNLKNIAFGIYKRTI